MRSWHRDDHSLRRPELRRISRRAAAVAPSATLAVDAKAKALQAAGEHVIGFGAGEPDFPTPAHIVEAAVIACRDPANHRYTPTGGIPALREAIAAKTRRDSGYEVAANQVLVTNGGKQAVSNAFAVLCDPGDEVLVLAPYWTTYPESIALAGGTPVIVSSDETTGFRSSVEDLEARLDAAHQGAALRVAVQPDRRRLPARRNRGHRPVGGVQGDLGADRRDLRAPRLRRGRAPLHARGRARAGRPLPGGQRRGQDLRHDRLAGGVAHRADRRHRQPPPTSRATRPPTWPTCRSAPRWPPSRATSTTSP